jgi:hypothetical protein
MDKEAESLGTKAGSVQCKAGNVKFMLHRSHLVFNTAGRCQHRSKLVIDPNLRDELDPSM